MKKSLLVLYRIYSCDYETEIEGYVIKFSDENFALLKRLLLFRPLAYNANNVDVLCLTEASGDICDDGTLEYTNEYSFFERIFRESVNIVLDRLRQLKNKMYHENMDSIEFDEFEKMMGYSSFANGQAKKVIEMLDCFVKPFWEMLFDGVEPIIVEE